MVKTRFNGGQWTRSVYKPETNCIRSRHGQQSPLFFKGKKKRRKTDLKKLSKENTVTFYRASANPICHLLLPEAGVQHNLLLQFFSSPVIIRGFSPCSFLVSMHHRLCISPPAFSLFLWRPQNFEIIGACLK